MMLEELQRRNYSPGTIRCYLRAIADFARYFHRSPDQLRPQHIREYQAYLFHERKLDPSTVTQKLAALHCNTVKSCFFSKLFVGFA
jgi:site-specific recombinase XerD